MNLKGYAFYENNKVVAWYDLKFANLHINKKYIIKKRFYLKKIKELGFKVIDVKEEY